MAGVGVGISDDLISLEIASPDVPDLTLIDLPGITRVAVLGQPENIEHQVFRVHKNSVNTSHRDKLLLSPECCLWIIQLNQAKTFGLILHLRIYFS